MPWESEKQAAWGHTKEGEKALGGAAKVAEWDAATPKGSLVTHDLATHGLAHEKKKETKKHLREMHIKELHSGGFVVHKHSGKGDPPTEHGAANMKELKAHLQEHMGDEPEPDDNPQEEAAE